MNSPQDKLIAPSASNAWRYIPLFFDPQPEGLFRAQYKGCATAFDSVAKILLIFAAICVTLGFFSGFPPALILVALLGSAVALLIWTKLQYTASSILDPKTRRITVQRTFLKRTRVFEVRFDEVSIWSKFTRESSDGETSTSPPFWTISVSLHEDALILATRKFYSEQEHEDAMMELVSFFHPQYREMPRSQILKRDGVYTEACPAESLNNDGCSQGSQTHEDL